MDIQVASNSERLIFDLCSCDSTKVVQMMDDLKKNGEFKISNEDLKKINEIFYAESLSDEETRKVINKVYKEQGVLVDPHTAVAIGVIDKLPPKENIVVLATAHPAKFSEVVLNATNIKPELPTYLNNILIDKEKYAKLPKDLKKIQSYILERV